MVRVTAVVGEINDIEENRFPNAVGFDVDSRDRLHVYTGTVGESGVVQRGRVVAVYPSGHWLRAWVGGHEADDDADEQDALGL
jgi:hypothetical protein